MNFSVEDVSVRIQTLPVCRLKTVWCKLLEVLRCMIIKSHILLFENGYLLCIYVFCYFFSKTALYPSVTKHMRKI